MQCRRPGFDPWVKKIPLGKGMTTQSSIFACRIPWTVVPCGLQSMGVSKSQTWLTNTHTQQILRLGVKSEFPLILFFHSTVCPLLRNRNSIKLIMYPSKPFSIHCTFTHPSIDMCPCSYKNAVLIFIAVSQLSSKKTFPSYSPIDVE